MLTDICVCNTVEITLCIGTPREALHAHAGFQPGLRSFRRGLAVADEPQWWIAVPTHLVRGKVLRNTRGNLGNLICSGMGAAFPFTSLHANYATRLVAAACISAFGECPTEYIITILTKAPPTIPYLTVLYDT